MIVNYLENLHQQMYEEKLNLERECRRKEILKNDNNKFIQALESSLDENFESFSPRDIDQESHLKIESLLEEQKEIELEINELEIKIAKLNTDLNELESVLKAARENEKSSIEKENLKEKSEIIQRKILELQEMERCRIAKNMHDLTIQNLTNMIHKVDICIQLIDVDPVRCRLELHAISKQIRDIIQDMRNIIYDLFPFSLNDINLDCMIEKEILKLRKSEILNVSYETLGESTNIPSIVSLHILHIVQEACSNILKHAKAKHVYVSVKYTEENVEIRMEDDGVGFAINNIQNLKRKDGSGFGIVMMQEHAFLFSGRLDIDSEPGKGTKIDVVIPIDKGG